MADGGGGDVGAEDKDATDDADDLYRFLSDNRCQTIPLGRVCRLLQDYRLPRAVHSRTFAAAIQHCNDAYQRN